MTASMRWIGAALLASAVALTVPGVRPAHACGHDEEAEAEEPDEPEVHAAIEEPEEPEAAEEPEEPEELEAAEEREEPQADADISVNVDVDIDVDGDDVEGSDAASGFDADQVERLLEHANELLERQLEHLLERLGDLESGGAAGWMELQLD